jgi:hypothetical protein
MILIAENLRSQLPTETELLALQILQLAQSTLLQHGWGNGYCFVPPGHPTHGQPYQALNECAGFSLSVHGGLTYAGKVVQGFIHRFGLPEDLLGWWCFGFDTNHWSDTPENWPPVRVFEEADRLYTQILKIQASDLAEY